VGGGEEGVGRGRGLPPEVLERDSPDPQVSTVCVWVGVCVCVRVCVFVCVFVCVLRVASARDSTQHSLMARPLRKNHSTLDLV